MAEIKRNAAGKKLTFSKPSNVSDIKITIKHEFGNSVKAETLVAAGPTTSASYTLTANDTAASGTHRVIWKYTDSGTVKTETTSYVVVDPYISLSTLLTEYPSLSTISSDFARVERIARTIINTYCGQNFYFIPNKTLVYDGRNNASLWTGLRIDELNSVLVNGSLDISEMVEVAPDTRRAIRRKKHVDTLPKSTYTSTSKFFGAANDYHITADWGWPMPPQNITDAAALLIQDMANDDRAYWKHGVSEVYMDTDRLRFNAEMISGTTGNLEVDVLLMDYILFTMDYISE